MNVQFKKGVLELCVLIVIAEKDYYGYELAEIISEQIQIADGSLYPLLRRLTLQNYLTTYHAVSSKGPSRKYYKMTEEGKDYLDKLLNEWNQFADTIAGFVKRRNDK
ncbi:PadR family transcriptional regulator, regulatory protein PadR [Seinonella peptonophila]|uniref:PadR family transcriptional regulator, regulatory protein PadR n=1 Tax=Seinonella peptonophila TaxID=112248 RepID=A0A1M4Y872_9BACL|nr:PadR family transcriptional regulator [Seinonella peptonophila]SHF01925.1 PadR family transcriptional regulator, regulatory protein PadR [Seinonella peptonophila]